ncbi:MAG: hydroxymethylglutaryl-CoA lyase [Solirubrobacteraceae bacterium]
MSETPGQHPRQAAAAVTLCDVGPRDGLQNDRAVLSPEVRAQLCARLAATGLGHIEAGSFVNPARVPQMAGAEEVFAALMTPAPSAVYSALVLNRRGLDRALAAGVSEVHLAYPLTDTFAQRNQGTTLADAAQAAAAMIAAGHEHGVRVTVTLAVAFGCPFEGRVDPGMVADHAARMQAAGADELMLADTIGVGVPAQVRRLLADALPAMAGRPVGLHLHNTRNTGYANALTGLAHGATILDASVAGLGGCPFAPRATGNIATEDLVYLLEGEGVGTGVDLPGLIAVAQWLAGILGRELPGLVYRAGPFSPGGD